MDIQLLRGRDFTEDDDQKRQLAVIINETAARKYFPGEDPLDKNVRFGRGKRIWRIVGVAADVKQFAGINAEVEPAVYLPHRQSSGNAMFLALRTSVDPLDLAAAVRQEVWAISHDLAISEIQTMEQIVSRSYQQPRFLFWLVGIFAVLALGLALVGIYSVMNYAVTERTREIGIRMTLGAQRSDVLRLIISQGLIMTLIGVGLGLLGASFLTSVMSGLLFGVSVTDPLTFGVVPLILTAIALLACYIPAQRAMKVDPIMALRYE